VFWTNSVRLLNIDFLFRALMILHGNSLAGEDAMLE